jgi:hypothetical protein
MNSSQKVRLSGGPDKTVTWIWLEESKIGFRVDIEGWA